MMRRHSPLLPAFLAFALLRCNEASGPSRPHAVCPDQSTVAPVSAARSVHAPKKVFGKDIGAIDGLRFATWDSVSAFFGGKEVKLAFTLDRRLYLVHWKAPGPLAELVDLTIGDEGWSGGAGNINSPLFSPDGARLAYGGSLSAPAMSFVLDLEWPGAGAWRNPVDTSGQSAFDPHFLPHAGPGYKVAFATDPGPVEWSDRCAQMGGSTYAALIGDSTVGAPEATGWPGSFKGGLSKDGRWAGTSYSPSALYDTEARKTTLLANLVQQCNPSINPFPVGSGNSDYLMILGFGGTLKTVAGDVTESVHQNLWIYGKENRIVWRGRLPPDPKYQQWQKPEWSTHPAYATGIALHDYAGGEARKGDLYAVRLGDLADADRTALREAAGYLRLADSVFTASSFSHLWIEP